MHFIEIKEDAANKRVGCSVSWCFLPEPSGSGFGLFSYGGPKVTYR